MHLRKSRETRTGLEGRRFLVVEDEPAVAMAVEDELLAAGARVVGPAAAVGDALLLIDAAARDGGLDAAVLNANLAGAPAGPVADRLAALGVPFAFTTGYRGAHPGTAGHGAAPVLEKPFGTRELLGALAALLLAPARLEDGPRAAAAAPP